MPDAEPPSPPSPLEELHRSLGAEVVWTAGGYAAPAGYGPFETEYFALDRSCAVADLSWLPELEVRGEDRVRFLNGMVTCDVARSPGAGCYGFVTDAKGKILSDVVVAVEEERLRLGVAPGRAEAIAAHLRKYIIMEPVEVSEASDTLALGVLGATAGERLAELLEGASPPSTPWAHVRGRLSGEEVHVLRHERLGVPAWILRVPRPRAEAIFRELHERLGGEPGLVGHAVLETVRVEDGIAAYGVDVDSGCFPQETGAEEEAISYTKGCYLGQEVVARIHYRGHVNRHLCGLLLESDEVPEAGGAVRYEGQESGRLTSVVRSPRLGTIGLAILHRRAAEIGNRVEIDGAGAAEIEALPFSEPGAA